MALGKDDIVRLGAPLGVDYAQTVSCYRVTDSGLACARFDYSLQPVPIWG